MKIAITGAAGLMGQNLIARLKRHGAHQIVAIDKHHANTRILRELHPDITVVEADMAEPGPWQQSFADVDAVVVGHAQIGGLVHDEFIRNNITATERLIEALADRRDVHLVHISSSVVNSAAVDWYTETKKAQEKLVVAAGHPTIVLRPTLMFGWFDRKHLGWLARFMQRVPVFPIPGDGQFIRQPLYAGDFCDIIIASLEKRLSGAAYNISGREHIAYIDLIKLIREATSARTRIVRIPYGLFWTLLTGYALVDRNPPFTTKQLSALVTPDVFEVIDWPGIFGVPGTSLRDALNETFRDPRYASVALEF
jgi:nucleoside-diphosphate-sugar epimerase